MRLSVNSMTYIPALRLRSSVLLMLWCAVATAADTENLGTIQSTAEQFALAQIDRTGLFNIEAHTTAMDSRLKLNKCEHPLQAFATGSAGNLSRTTVGVRCEGAKPWTLYVPVSITASANAVFTVQPLSRGDAIHGEYLEIRQLPLEQLPRNYFSTIEPLLNMQLSQNVRSQIALTPNAVKPRQIVQRGQEIIILASGRNVQVRMIGIALNSGASGELISVRNNNSGRTIEATIVDADTVSVKM